MDSLVSTDWLARTIGASDLVIADASYHLPDAARDAAAEHAQAHIPGAVFLDLATLIDRDSPIDNTAPGPEAFAARMRTLGIGNASRIVVYDDSAVRSATRAWFLLTMYGAGDVAILDGGLAKWRAEGRPLQSAMPNPQPQTFTVSPAFGKLRSKQDVLVNLATQAEQVIDARGAGRFTGDDKEARAGIASGHIPGSRNVPYASLYNSDGTMKDEAALRAAFEAAGVDLARPLVTTCGSGMTACALAFALDRIGKQDVALYDGSWTEWGADADTPKATGRA